MITLLDQRRDWIEDTLKQQRQRPSLERTYLDGELWSVAGQDYRLKVVIDPDSTAQVNLLGTRLELSLPNPDHSVAQRRELLQHWYQQQAESLWPQRLQHWSGQLELRYSSLKIRPYKSRWGSCSAQGRISLNTLLAMAPQAVLDYVMIHELCHLRHLNHSKAYWALVEQHCPDARELRRWLRQHGSALRF